MYIPLYKSYHEVLKSQGSKKIFVHDIVKYLEETSDIALTIDVNWILHLKQLPVLPVANGGPRAPPR